MNLFDWFLIAIVAYSIVMAFLRGIILELFTLGGLIIASPAAAQILAFLLIVVGIMILSTHLGKALNSTAHAIGLGFFDRLLGAVFGFARGCLFSIAILMAVAA